MKEPLRPAAATDDSGTFQLPEKSLRALIDSVLEHAIFMLDPDGYVISWNTGAEHLKGYRAEEIIGHHFSVFYLPEDRADGKPGRALATARDRGGFEEDGWRVAKDGTRLRVHVVIHPVLDGHGRLIGFTKITRDISNQWRMEQALRESEQRFRIMIEQVRDYAIFMIDPQARISTWNLGAQRIKGYSSAEVIGRHLSMFYPPEDVARGTLDRLLRTAAETGVAHNIGWRIRKDGSRFWADVTLTALYDGAGRHQGFAKVVRDLTERVAAEEQARAYEAARDAIRVRDEFLSIAAHELRTPLTATQLQMQGVQMLLRQDPSRWDQERIACAIDRALGSAGRLAVLVERLLDVSRITAGRIQLQPTEFALTEVVDEAVDRLRETAQAADCRIAVSGDPSIVGSWDRLRLEQALINLLSNACKYAAGSDVDIGVARDGDGARLWVRDRGPGIPAESIERIFDRFERAVPAENYGGLGLGLYVTRQIAEAHGGSIQVDSEPGKGCTFIIRLPIETVQPD